MQQAPDQFPGANVRFLLDGPAGHIEVNVDVPEEASARRGTAVICHPHPVHGGTMHNKVVTMIERALRELGLATVRFNFRGVGQSEGQFDEGRGEGDDLNAVVDWVRQVKPADDLWLAGFSFGSYIALRAAVPLETKALITIAPPVERGYELDDVALPTCPWLVVQGEEDEVVDPDAVFAWLDKIKSKPVVVRMPKTSHFFHRRLLDLRGAIKNGVKTWLPSERED